MKETSSQEATLNLIMLAEHYFRHKINLYVILPSFQI